MHYGLHLLIHVLRRAFGERASNFLLNPFFGAIDGSDQPGKPQPLYSVAEARRKQGRYAEAREHLLGQLEQFPEDFRVQMMLAEIEAQDFGDVASAETVIQRLIAQKAQPPGSIVGALSTLADWHLKYGRDSEAAGRCFEQIAELYPGSEWAVRAAQRIAHLPTPAMLGRDAAPQYPLPHTEEDIGLRMTDGLKPEPENDFAAEAGRLVKRLEDYPLDWEARETLAFIYARDFQRLDLAESQLEQLLQFPNQPPKQLVRWLNLLADFQVKHGGTIAGANAALQRIMDLNPGAAAANVAQNRIARLKLEFKGQEKSQAVTPGSYETDVGLKNRAAR
jgi:tetratricopeptide (TPR) repeat protein